MSQLGIEIRGEVKQSKDSLLDLIKRCDIVKDAIRQSDARQGDVGKSLQDALGCWSIGLFATAIQIQASNFRLLSLELMAHGGLNQGQNPHKPSSGSEAVQPLDRLVSQTWAQGPSVFLLSDRTLAQPDTHGDIREWLLQRREKQQER